MFGMRLPISVAQEIINEIGKGKPFKNRSEACLLLIQEGLRVRKMKKTFNDPIKKKKFEKLLKAIITEKYDQRTFETMEVEDLENIIFLATEVKNKKVEQLMLSVD